MRRRTYRPGAVPPALGVVLALVSVAILLAPTASSSPVNPSAFRRAAPFVGMSVVLGTNVSAANQTTIVVPNAFNTTTGVGVTSSRADFVYSPRHTVTSWTLNAVRLTFPIPLHRTGSVTFTVTWRFSYDLSLYASRTLCSPGCFSGTSAISGWAWADVLYASGGGAPGFGQVQTQYVNRSLVAAHNASTTLSIDADQIQVVLKLVGTLTKSTRYVLDTGYWADATASLGRAAFNMGGVGDDRARLVSIVES